MMRSVSLVCALALGALGCSGQSDETLRQACDDYTDCPQGVGCNDGYCQGDAPATDEGEATVRASGVAQGAPAQVGVSSSGGHCADLSPRCEVTEGATVTFRAMQVD